MRSLSLSEAVQWFEALPASVGTRHKPASLHPAYVHADAQRNPCLQPVFAGFERLGQRWLHGMHTTDIPGTPWRDASAPYGYAGGWGSTDDVDFLSAAWQAHGEWLRAQRVVVEYLRFHPLAANHLGYGGKITPNRRVVWMNVQGDFAVQYAPRLRTVLHKADRSGLTVTTLALADSSVTASSFAAYHRAAMQAMGTSAFYSWPDTYFEALAAVPGTQVVVCHAEDTDAADNNHWLAAALVLNQTTLAEYHLAATVLQGRAVAASSFLLHRIAQQAQAAGQQALYLGGGTSAAADNSLLFFKAAFSPLQADYVTGTQVLNADAYRAVQAAHTEAWAAHPERPIFHRLV